jgi:hypothetical protein
MPDWNSAPPRGAPMVQVPWTGPYYPADAAEQGKTSSSPSDVFVALKRTLGLLGAWPWDPDSYDRTFSNEFSHGSSRGPGVAGVQKWAKIEPTGWIGLSTWNFLRSVLIQEWKDLAGFHAMDEIACDLIRTADVPAAPAPLSPREIAMQHFAAREGYTEQPAGSNCDSRADGIRTAQDATAAGSTWLRGQPWCGCWAFYALQAAGVEGLGSWMASVALIEDRARRKLSPFTGWTADRAKVRPGDLVVIGGRGVHVATVRGFDGPNTLTWSGNTSSGSLGSQANGGGAFKRWRSPSSVYGYALVKYPGEDE